MDPARPAELHGPVLGERSAGRPVTSTRGGARPGAGRPESGTAGKAADPYRVPLSRERMAEVREYAALYGLKIAAAVDSLLAFALDKHETETTGEEQR